MPQGLNLLFLKQKFAPFIVLAIYRVFADILSGASSSLQLFFLKAFCCCSAFSDLRRGGEREPGRGGGGDWGETSQSEDALPPPLPHLHYLLANQILWSREEKRMPWTHFSTMQERAYLRLCTSSGRCMDVCLCRYIMYAILCSVYCCSDNYLFEQRVYDQGNIEEWWRPFL